MQQGGASVRWTGRGARAGACVIAVALLMAGLTACELSPTGRLGAPTTLARNDWVRTADHDYRLAMRADGNLVVVGPGSAVVWQTATTGIGHTATIATDGTLTVLDSTGTALWSTATHTAMVPQPGPVELRLGDDGELATVDIATGRRAWSNGYHNTGDCLPGPLDAGDTLFPGECIASPNGQFRLTMGTDGRLTEHDGTTTVWTAPTTTATPGALATLQPDATLTVITPDDTTTWQATPAGTPSGTLRLHVHDDGEVTLTDTAGTRRWSNGHHTTPVECNGTGLLPDTYLLLGDCLQSLDGATTATLHSDGALRITRHGYPAFEVIPAAQHQVAHLHLRPTGELALTGTTDAWTTPTAGHPGATATLPDNDGFQIADTTGTHWRAFYVGGLTPGQALQPGQKTLSPNGRYAFTNQLKILSANRSYVFPALIDQSDGTRLWNREEWQAPPGPLTMQSDGNLSIPIRGSWQLDLTGLTGATFQVLDTGVARIIDADGHRWFDTALDLPPMITGGYNSLSFPDGSTGSQSGLEGPSSITSPNGAYRLEQLGSGLVPLTENATGERLWVGGRANTFALFLSMHFGVCPGGVVCYIEYDLFNEVVSKTILYPQTTIRFGSPYLSLTDEGLLIGATSDGRIVFQVGNVPTFPTGLAT